MSFNDYDDLDKYAAAGVTSTTFPQLTLYNHPDWRFAVLKFMHTFGPAGLAIFNGMKRTTKKPAMLASWTYRVYDQDTGEDKEFTVRWSDDPDRHLREYNAKLDKWQAREDKVKALEKRLWAALLSCLEPELERRTTLREELWGPIAATADTYELWQLGEIELQMGEIERCRSIYAKYIEKMPHNCAAWRNFAQLEATVGEATRARAIYELAASQVDLDMPEVLWRAYIDFEVSEAELDRARALYTRLLERSGHVKVWIAFALFELEYGGSTGGGDNSEEESKSSPMSHLEAARAVFNKGYDALKSQGLKEERLLLLESWRDAEAAALQQATVGEGEEAPSREHLSAVEGRFPRKIKMKRAVYAEDGLTELGQEEYFDYIFPDDEKKIVGMKLLEQAMMWKKAAAAAAAAANASANNEGEESGAHQEGQGGAEGEIDIDGSDNESQSSGSSSGSSNGSRSSKEASALGKRKNEHHDE